MEMEVQEPEGRRDFEELYQSWYQSPTMNLKAVTGPRAQGRRPGRVPYLARWDEKTPSMGSSRDGGQCVARLAVGCGDLHKRSMVNRHEHKKEKQDGLIADREEKVGGCAWDVRV
jgi:hypothetical protein